ncbi:phosphogluconate dehydrogenase (NAD(+)-dependent, decarboxylating) [Petrocella sp. FN5]|uniref:phosphogluconate dehydrogenase (NAD(+)-dependent, decarboxylating) n=1 Tax=Petrocella sp. FN5 TaxID=3032002 RepID=UPI0023DCD386|nr:decarboxylating 6-phosphogluconate dehydrogenase [Petrocella sp. FN5]MDF1616520.1 decarboxylating 6-phosphogluconate dehydrogenase [Petrocella sp. FN5]
MNTCSRRSNMKIGLIGLGKMGYNLALNMRDKGLDVGVYNRSKAPRERIKNEGVRTFEEIEDMIDALESPKVVWIMVTAGPATEAIIEQVAPLLSAGDIIVDGGNSRFSDTLRRGDLLEEKGIYFVDAGTSGGTDGARYGACMMVGGDKRAIATLEPYFKVLNVEEGYLHCGKRGSGHYVKMVHNGIEYGMMQAVGEGLEIIRRSEFDVDFEKVANVWNHGSIIAGYLMQMTKQAFANNGMLEDIVPRIDALGEGQWTVEEAIRLGVSAPVITQSLFIRNASKDDGKFSDRVVAALRNEFGGHELHKR